MIVEMESSKYIEVLLHCEKNEKKKMRAVSMGGVYIFPMVWLTVH